MRRALFVFLLAVAACRREPPAPVQPAPPSPLASQPVSDADERASLTNIVRGTTIVSRTGELFLDASAANAIDGDPTTAWINPPLDFPQSIVVALPARARIERVGLRTLRRTETANRVQFEESLDGVAWRPLTTVTAAVSDDAQWFDVAPSEAAYLRVTMLDGRPNVGRVRLYSVLARGTELAAPHMPPLEGCWSLNGWPARFAQRGARVTGVIEIGEQPLYLDGGSDGRTIRFVWIRGNDYGLALMTLSPDGKHLTALEWHEEAIPLFHGDPWFGERASCGAAAPREDVAQSLLRRAGRYSFFVTEASDIDRLAILLASLRVPARVVVHEFREATPEKNKAAAQREIERLRAALGARAGGIPFIAAGSDAPRQQPVTEAMRALYSSVDVEIPHPEPQSGEGSPALRR